MIMFAAPALAFVLACQAVDGDRILGKDLAEANPAFAEVPADAVIGTSPLPGVQRIVHPDELTRIAKQYNVALAPLPGEVCFVRATEPLTADRLLDALKKAIPGADIEILDFSHLATPPGTLEFKRSGLSLSGFWRGQLIYSESRSLSIWVKVRITTQQSWIEAAVPLDTTKTVSADQLVVRSGPRVPFGPPPLDSIDAAAGRRPLRTIRPGEPIFATMLTSRHDVERGENVSVEVLAGLAKISFEAIAESSGRIGETVLIKNPQNGRYFQARIDSKGKVSVHK